ncbi:MAG: sulfocyanin-like copper-binding protein [Candidatus Dormibacteraceae bacterium]
MIPNRASRTLKAAALLLCMAACDPVMGTGAGNPPDPSHYIKSNPSDRTVVITLIAGYPASDFQFNYNGYGSGALVVTIPVGWTATIQCENHGTVPNSCAVVSGRDDTRPIQPAWSTPDPVRGLDPGKSASFEFAPTSPGSYRIASLVGGNEASGMWADLEVTASGKPGLAAPGS